ncbi:MAG TPA: ribosome silencing factor [Candidatus Kapabacteria bacterium]|nr:ribosome silencing factor [Candidatus Kapabacteria bacterium]
MAVLCARLAEDKLADEVLILNLEGIDFAPSDYFVICSCDSEIQVAAVVDNIVDNTRALKIQRPRVEGEATREWVLIDYFDVVVHVMKKEIRHFYKLEKLWGDAQFLKIDGDGKPKVMKFEEVKPFFKEHIID